MGAARRLVSAGPSVLWTSGTYLLEECLCFLQKGVSLRARVVVGLLPEVVGYPQVALPICLSLLVRVVLNKQKHQELRAVSQTVAATADLFLLEYNKSDSNSSTLAPIRGYRSKTFNMNEKKQNVQNSHTRCLACVAADIL